MNAFSWLCMFRGEVQIFVHRLSEVLFLVMACRGQQSLELGDVHAESFSLWESFDMNIYLYLRHSAKTCL